MNAAAPQLRRNVTLVRKKRSRDFSITGLIYLSMMMFMGIAAMHTQANLLFGVFGLMIGVLLISGIISKLVLRKLFVQRVLPEHGIVGRPLTIQYEITNRKRFWPSLSVMLAELDGVQAFTKQPHAYMLHAAAQMTAVVPAEVIAKRRGLHHLDQHQIMTSFPFGFVKRAIERSQKDSLLIYPAIGRVDQRVIQMCRSAETSGAVMRPQRGGADEFYGVKDFRAGENPRWIYWKRSAHTGTLVAKEMTLVSPPRLLLVIDTFQAERSMEADATIERTIAMAASLASEALEQGMSVGLVAWSKHPVHITNSRGKRHRRDLLTALAVLPVNTEFQQRDLLDESFRHRHVGTTLVLLTPQEARMNFADAVRGSVIVLSPQSPHAGRWFKFDRSVDFTRCAPVEK